MGLMNFVRIAKIVALLAFFLPWAAVSCQGIDVATASGIELMQGKMTANPDFERQAAGAFGGGANAGAFEPSVSSSTNVPELGINFFAVGAAVVVLAGLGMAAYFGYRGVSPLSSKSDYSTTNVNPEFRYVSLEEDSSTTRA